jgi:glucose/arabinose dehydrogenase
LAVESALPRCAVEALENRTMLAANLPAGFEESTVYSGLNAPTSMQIAPDGRIFVSEKGGAIRIIKNGQLLANPFMQLQVDSFRDRGVSAIELDPNFSTNGYVYVHYNTYDPAKPDQQNNASKVRLSRFTANGDTVIAGSETILVNNVPSDTGFHPGGFLDFGPDGKIYVGFGTPDVTRYSQDLMSFAGKVLRINPDGTVPSDNPFFGNPTARGAIWAYGFRNPFTGAVDPTTGKIFVNDVGENSYEEVNELKKGKNYGWPTAEGYTNNPNLESPFFAYDHSFHPNNEAAVTGGLFYHGNAWPSEYQGKYFFADYDEGTLRFVNPSTPGQATMFGTDLYRAVDLDLAPDGNVYYLSIWSGEIRKIAYVGQANRNPNAVASATSPTSGLSPLNVSFTGAGSTDPDPNTTLTYSWNFGDGANGNGLNVSHNYTSNGTYLATLTVSDGQGGSDVSDPITITVGNEAPTGVIETPLAGSTYRGGQTINFSGSASDPQNGILGASAFKWRVSFLHGTDAQGTMDFNGVTSGSFVVPTQSLTDPNQRFRIQLTVTDNNGLSHVSFRDVLPEMADVTLSSNIPGLTINLDNQPRTAPYTFPGVVGLTRNLSAPLSQSLNGVTYTFVSWSDGGAATHDVSSPETDSTFTAIYETTVGSPVPGTIQVEDFDEGGQNISYYDTDSGNTGGAYRNTRVDIQTTGDTGGGYNVGWTKAGEWLNYTLNVASTGIYDVNFRVASKVLGGTFHLEIDGVNVTGTMQVPNTTAWQTYQTITKTGVTLSAGSHVARLVMDSVSAGTGNVGNFNWMSFAQGGGEVNQPPQVNLTAPSNGATYTAGQTATFVANATDTDGTVNKVEFYAGNTKIGEDLGGVWDVDWTNLQAGTYEITARAIDDDGAVTVSSPITITVNPAGGGTPVNGLTGEYYDNQDLTDPKLTRVDPTVNFYWGNAAPHASMGSDSFSVRWTGQVMPQYSQNYTFYVDGNNGVRLWVNDQLIIDRWTNAYGEVSGQIALTGGVKYNIKLEFFEFTGTANAKLSWQSASRSKQVIPTDRLFTSIGASGNESPTVNVSSPASGTTYTAGQAIPIVAVADDTDGNVTKVEFYDGNTLIGEDGNASGGWTFNWLNAATGAHQITARATDNNGATTISLPISVTVNPSGGGETPLNGLTGEYFDNQDLTNSRITRIDANVNFNWGTGSPHASVGSDSFSARWTGQVMPQYSQLYKFYVDANNGVRLWVNDQLIIDRWNDSWGESNGSINLLAGVKYNIKLEYYDFSGSASAKLSWSSPSRSKQVIPTDRLFTAAAGQSPYNGNPAWPVAGTIQAENFDDGGQGVAYNDAEAANQGGDYRSTGVDIDVSTDAGGGYDVGWTTAGEWLEYTLNVATTRAYTFEARVASRVLGGTFHVEIDGVNVTGSIQVPDTTAWTNYQTIEVANVNLTAGQRVMRVVMDSVAGETGYTGNFNWFRFT